MMIKKITPEDTYHLRQLVLRPGLNLESCKFPMDFDQESFHLGSFHHNSLVSISSYQYEENPLFEGKQYRLRGMATHPNFRQLGHASSLIKEAEKKLMLKKCTCLWFNARIKAIPFYQRLGYIIKGSEFEIEGVGAHHLMFKYFNKC